MASEEGVGNWWDEYPNASGVTQPKAEMSASDDPFADPKYDIAPRAVGVGGETFAKAAAGSAIETSPMIPMTIAGAKLGAMTPIPGGTAIGGALGFGASLFAGSEMREQAVEAGIATPYPEQLPEEQRPSAYAGEVAGGALTGGLGIAGMARTGIRAQGRGAIGRAFNNILHYAEKKTGRFLGVEMGMGLSAAGASYGAESYAPGETAVRMASEITAGFFNPVRVMKGAWDGTVNSARIVWEKISPEARKTKAGQYLQDLLIERGEDPTAVARMLLAHPEFEDMPLTIAQMTGSPTLAALHKTMGKHDPNVTEVGRAYLRDAETALVANIELLRRTGDPAALQEASEAMRRLFATTLDNNIREAEQAAIRAAEGISADTPTARAELGRKARDILDVSRSNARKAEKELWDQVDRDVPMAFDALATRYQAILDDIPEALQEEALPKPARQFMQGLLAKDAEPPTTGELIKFRSLMLEMSRDAVVKGDMRHARIYNALGDAALDDLDTAFDGSEAYSQARTFSRELNNVFTRSFAGQAVAKGQYGERIAPELLLNRATAGGSDAAALHLQDLEDATRFMETRGLANQDDINNMLDAQERMIRITAAEVVDPTTGRISKAKVNSMLRKQAVLMERFPEVKKSLQAALKSEDEALRWQALGKRSTAAFEQRSAFAKFLKISPRAVSKHVGEAILSDKPDKKLLDLVKVAKRSSAARDGLRSATIDAALKYASDGRGGISFTRFEEFLLKPKLSGKKAPIDLLVENDVFDRADVQNINKIMRVAKKLAASEQPDLAVPEYVDASGILTQALSSGVGATIATKIAGIMPGQGVSGRGLIIAGAGAKAARRYAIDMPMASINNILAEAMTNPELAHMLLTKPKSQKEAIKWNQQIHAYLTQSGVLALQEEMEGEQEPKE